MKNTKKFFPGREIENSRDLHLEFKKLGLQRNKLTYKLLNLLPEIYERKIYERYGCATIYEYAGKFAGLSKSVVEKRLRLERHLADKPCLKKMIAKEGIHKVDLVARVATPKTDRMLAKQVETMSKTGLFELAKEIRQTGTEPKTMEHCNAAAQTLKIELDEEMTFLFLKVKKEMGGNVTNKEVMKRILQGAAKESSPANVLPGKKKTKAISTKAKPTRYIPVTIKRQKLVKTNGKCAYPNCNKPHEVLHHTKRYAEHKTDSSVHDSIVPLCRAHHEFAHSGLIKNEQNQTKDWQLRVSPKQTYADFMWMVSKSPSL